METFREYIPCQKHWKNMFGEYPFFRIVDKFPMQNIKKKKLRNKINPADIAYMLTNFSKDAWMPVTLNQKYFLVDGQHRLELARQMGLAYIDVVIQQ
jgi:hypothetical protein